MKYLIILFIAINFSSQSIAQELDGKSLIEKSQQYHDPNRNWRHAKLEVHIQEPRVGNPFRYSIVKMNIEDNSFELTRNRGEHLTTHIIDRDGKSHGLLDGESVSDAEVLKQYRLNPEMNNIYKTSYDFRFGMPMALTRETVKKYGDVSKVTFNDQEAYKIEVELYEPIFSEFWTVYISTKNYKLLGVEITFPDDPTKGERLYYDGEYEFDGIIIPRMTHWHEYDGDSYSGSDIIVKTLPK